MADFSRENLLLTSSGPGQKSPAYHADPFASPELPRLGKMVTSIHFTESDPARHHPLSDNPREDPGYGYYVPTAVADTDTVEHGGSGRIPT